MKGHEILLARRTLETMADRCDQHKVKGWHLPRDHKFELLGHNIIRIGKSWPNEVVLNLKYNKSESKTVKSAFWKTWIPGIDWTFMVVYMQRCVVADDFGREWVTICYRENKQKKTKEAIRMALLIRREFYEEVRDVQKRNWIYLWHAFVGLDWKAQQNEEMRMCKGLYKSSHKRFLNQLGM